MIQMASATVETICFQDEIEFAKLRALRAFVPYVPSRFTCLDFYAH